MKDDASAVDKYVLGC